MCRVKNSIVASYIKLVVYGVGFGLFNTSFFSLASLTTSFNGNLGSFSLSIVYAAFPVFLFATPSLVKILGAKTCAVGSGLCVLVYSVSYFYPSWYTFTLSSLIMGVGFGLLYTSAGAIKNDEVLWCVEHWKVDRETYQGRFSGIIVSLGLGAAVCLAGLVNLVILSAAHVHRSSPNGTCMVDIVSTSLAGNTNSTTHYSSVVSPVAYYVLVATITAVSLLCILTMSVMRGAAYHQCRVCSFGLKEALRSSATHAVKVVKQACTPAYGLVLPLRMNQGFVAAYFFGVFTKRYVTECVGVEYVGVAVVVRGISATLGSFGSGWLKRWTTSYVMVLVCIGGLEVGSLVFLIAWERQPSFGVIVIFAAIFGLCYGLNETVGLAYSGTAPGYSVAGYCAFTVEYSVGQAIQFFVSEYISPETNLFVLLVVTILAVPLFTIADVHYGSGTSRKICGEKRPASVDIGCDQHEPASVSVGKEKDGVDSAGTEIKPPSAMSSPPEDLHME